MIPHDSASDIINAFIASMKAAFNPADSIQPPIGGGSENVRFFAGDGPALAAFEAHTNGGKKCREPFLWVRAARRYHYQPGKFPAPIVDVADNCISSPRALAVEVGVGRCSVAVKPSPKLDEYAAEAEVSLDDSWRVDLAMCMAADSLRSPKRQVGIDTVNPYGPEGGVIAWVGTAYVQL